MKKKILIFLITIILGLGFFMTEAKAGSDENVYGWAWSENIGWISFNSTNCDPASPRAPFTNTDYSLCPGSYANYGVHIDPDTGVFSGGAWSSNIGWISFADFDGDGDIDADDKNISGSPCEGSCQATFNFDTKKVSGWARALAPVSVKYERYEEFHLSGYDFGEIRSNLWEAGVFVNTSQYQANYVSLILGRYAYPEDDIGDVIVSIQGVSGGDPNGIDICKSVINGNSLPLIDGSYGMYGSWPYDPPDSWTDIFLGECNLSAGVAYAIVVKAPDAEQDRMFNEVRWYYDIVGPGGANRLRSDDGGATWTESDTAGHLFQIWKGDPLEEPDYREDPPALISGGWDGWIKLRGIIESSGAGMAMMTRDEISMEVFGLEYDDFLEIVENHPESPIDVSFYSSFDTEELRQLTNFKIPGTNVYISVPEEQTSYKKQTVYGAQTGYGEDDKQTDYGIGEEEEEEDDAELLQNILRAIQAARDVFTPEALEDLDEAEIYVLDNDMFSAMYIWMANNDLEDGYISQEVADLLIDNVNNIVAASDRQGDIIIVSRERVMEVERVMKAKDESIGIGPAGVFIHEYSHIIDKESRYSGSEEWQYTHNDSRRYYLSRTTWEGDTIEYPKATDAGFVSEYARSNPNEDLAETVRAYRETGGDPSRITDDSHSQELIQERFDFLVENGIVESLETLLPFLRFNPVRAQLSPFDFDIVQVQLTQAGSTTDTYGVSLNSTPDPSEFEGWAWGSDDTPEQAVIGWISFNCKDRGTCGSVDYKVMTGLAFNDSPSVVNLNAEQTSGCSSVPIVRFSWDYEDNDNLPPGTDPQSAYEIQISDAGVLVATLSGGSATFREYAGLDFGTTYSWRVRVQDTNGPVWSEWADGPSITPRRWPEVDFTWCPEEPFMNETVQFCSIFEPGVCELGICSDMAGPANNLTICAAGCSFWEWDFDNDGTSEITSTANPSYIYSSLGSQTVRLTVTDANGKSCSKTNDLSTEIPLPIWKEIPPF